MTYQTLYRKYRPKKFEYIYGQDSIVKTLQNAIKTGKISHAYLFTGPRGTGKTSCAKLFAKSINCLNNNEGDACNCCENCKSFNQNSNPDIIEIDAASNNGVDEIREIKNKVNLVPSMSKYKVYIIDEVHMLSIGAFNALLKTLEEPPKYVIFILATTEPQKLPNTVISRCQRYDFKSINNIEMKKCLMNIANKENINITEDALNEIVNNSRGGMRDAIGMLDQAYIYSNEKINVNDIEILSGNISDKDILDFFDKLLNCNYNDIIKKINFFYQNGKDFLMISRKLLSFLHKGLISKKTNSYENLSNDEKMIFKKCTDLKLYLIMDLLNETINDLSKSYQKELTFEVKMIQIIDKLIDCKSNVSRETLDDETKTLKNISEKFGLGNKNIKLIYKIEELKNIRINNILKESTRKNIEFINSLWNNISDYLIEEQYKISAGILLEGKPVAASDKGLIITFPVESLLKRIEEEYDLSKKIIKKVYNSSYKLVYITEKKWQEIRPGFAEKAKKNELQLIDEKKILLEIHEMMKKNSVTEFADLIEMEEK